MPDHSTPEGRRCPECGPTGMHVSFGAPGGVKPCPTPAPVGGEALFTPEVVAKLERAMARVPDTDRAAELLREARAALAAAKPPASPADDPTGLYYPLLFLCEAVAPVLTWLEEDDDETATPTSAEGGAACPECEGACYVTYPIDHNATRTAPCPRCNAAGIVPGPAATGGPEPFASESFDAVNWDAQRYDHGCDRDTLLRLTWGFRALRRQLAEAEGVSARIGEVLGPRVRMADLAGEWEGWNLAARVEFLLGYTNRATELEARATTAERLLEEASRSWRCFFCDEVFTDKSAARRHFDPSGIGGARSNAQCLHDAADAQVRAVKQTLTASQQEVARLRNLARRVLDTASSPLSSEHVAAKEVLSAALSSSHQSTGQGA